MFPSTEDPPQTRRSRQTKRRYQTGTAFRLALPAAPTADVLSPQCFRIQGWEATWRQDHPTRNLECTRHGTGKRMAARTRHGGSQCGLMGPIGCSSAREQASESPPPHARLSTLGGFHPCDLRFLSCRRRRRAHELFFLQRVCNTCLCRRRGLVLPTTSCVVQWMWMPVSFANIHLHTLPPLLLPGETNPPTRAAAEAAWLKGYTSRRSSKCTGFNAAEVVAHLLERKALLRLLPQQLGHQVLRFVADVLKYDPFHRVPCHVPCRVEPIIQGGRTRDASWCRVTKTARGRQAALGVPARALRFRQGKNLPQTTASTTSTKQQAKQPAHSHQNAKVEPAFS